MCSNMCVWRGHNVHRKRWFRWVLHRQYKCCRYTAAICDRRHVSSVMCPGNGRAFILIMRSLGTGATPWAMKRNASGYGVITSGQFEFNLSHPWIQFVCHWQWSCSLSPSLCDSFSTHTRRPHHNGRNSKWAHATRDCFPLRLVFSLAFSRRLSRKSVDAEQKRIEFYSFQENFDFLVPTATSGEY